MSGIILWLPGETATVNPPVERSHSKKRSSQAQLSQDLEIEESLSTFVNLSTLDIVEISSPQAWAQALQEIEQAGICGLDLGDYRAGSSLLQG